MRAPMALPLSGLIAGIALAFAGASMWAGIISIAFSLLIFFVLRYVSRSPAQSVKWAKANHIWIAGIFLGVGLVSADLQRPDHLADNEMKSYVAARGRVADVTNRTSGDCLLVEVWEWVDASGHRHSADNCRILLNVISTPAQTDDEVSFPVTLKRIEDSPNNFHTGYAEALARNGILYKSECEPSLLKVEGYSPSLSGWSQRVRARIETMVENSHLSVDSKNFVNTLLLGDRDYLDSEIRNDFSDAGLSHILALSGMHIALIGGIIMWLLFPLNFFGYYRVRLILTALIMVGYALISGMSPSTVRAALMCASVAVAVWLERKHSAWAALLLATFVILLFAPSALFDAGMQLSFICVASLIFFVSPLNPFEQRKHPRCHSVASFLLCSLMATAGTWWVTAAHFHTVPIMFLPANIIILPLLPVWLLGAVIYLALFASGISADFLAHWLDFALTACRQFTGWITLDGHTALRFTPHWVAILLWGAAFIVAAYLVSHKWDRKGIGVSALMFTFAISATIFFGNQTKTNGILLKNFPGEYAAGVIVDGREQHVVARNHCVSRLRHPKGIKIVILDLPISSCESGELTEADIVMIGKGYKDKISDIGRYAPDAGIVIHPSVRRKREAQLIAEADSLGVNIHSIRRQGSWRIEF